MTRETARQIAKIFNKRQTLDRFLGIEFVSIGAGEAVMKMTVTKDMMNVFGSAHGGAVFALADGVFAYACNSRNIMSVASGCTIDYLAPSFPGDVLTATGKFQGGRGKQGIYDVMITNQKDQLIAAFRGKSHATREQVLTTKEKI